MTGKPLYMISIVSEMMNLHPQTIRQYEKMGLIKPFRTEGNTRLYSDEDVNKLKYIIKLTKELKVNIAGVEIIMALNEEIQKLNTSLENLQNKIENTSISKNINIEIR